jgi:hypothetical protein
MNISYNVMSLAYPMIIGIARMVAPPKNRSPRSRQPIIVLSKFQK